MTVRARGTSNHPQATVRGLARGLDLLALFDEQTPELTVSQISRRLQLPLSTTYRILNTMVARGYLERHRSHGTVRLGLVLIRLGRLARSSRNLTEVARPELERLARETGETAVLMVPQPSHVVCLANVEGPYPIRPRSIGVGELCPYNAGAVPMAILAFLRESEQERILDAGLPTLTHNTLHSRRAIRKRCQEIQAAGFAYSRDEAIEGTAAVGAPVFADSGLTVIGAVGVTGVVDRIMNLEGQVMAAAKRISRGMGASEGSATK